MAQVAFVTYGAQPGITEDDALAAEALTSLTGLEVVGVPWDEPAANWDNFRAVILRSLWDYFLRPAEFTEWLDRLSATGKPVFNSSRLVRWNHEKTYLRELAAAGVAIVPTYWSKQGEAFQLAEVLRDRAWTRAVVKPTISGAAFETWVTSTTEAASSLDQSRVDRLSSRGGVMVQPFVDEIVTLGEWSMIFFEGEFSHAIVKTPAHGDFRVQAQFGASRKAVQPSRGLLEQAQFVIKAATGITGEAGPLYARVDGVLTESDGRFLLMELEVIEPELSFKSDGEAPNRFARAIARRLAVPGI